MTRPSLRCRLGFHSWALAHRDADGTYRCRRCSRPGPPRHVDAEEMPPGALAGGGPA